MKDSDKHAIRFSREGLSDIAHLEALPEFTRFIAQLQSKADEWANLILHESLPAQEREELRLKRLGLLEVLRLPAEARLGHTRVLEGFGALPDGENPTS